jgi:photosystem II stability/assembly factor-like uncharacterized protein
MLSPGEAAMCAFFEQGVCRLRPKLGIALLLCAAAAELGALNWHGCALAPDGQRAWVATIDTTLIFRTEDAGLNWSKVGLDSLTNHDFFDVFFLDSLNGWTCGTLAEVQHTTDGGNNWVWQGFGASKFFTRIQFLDPTHGWAAGGSAIMGRWEEGSATWIQTFMPHSVHADTADFYGISFTDTLHGWMCAGRYPAGDTFQRGQGYIVNTTDGGYSWNRLVRDTVYDYFDIEFADTLTGWVVGGDDQTMQAYIAHTTDGGVTWAAQPTSPGAGMLRGLCFKGPNLGWAVGKYGTILHTDNGGGFWMAQVSGVDSTLFDVDFSDSLHGIASGFNAVVYTSDGGLTWTPCRVGIAERGPVGAVAPMRTVSELRVAENPGRRRLRLEAELVRTSDVQVRVWNGLGRPVRRLWAGRLGRGQHSFVWDGRDQNGNPVSSGVYVAGLDTDSDSRRVRIVCLRE